MKRSIAGIALAFLLAACGGADGEGPAPTGASAAGSNEPNAGAVGAPEPARGVDPRRGGLEVALGEWAVTLEAGAIRPGRVTFVVANRGTIGHGFEIELEGEGDSSGHGSGDEDGIKAETNPLRPGERAELSLELPAGVYKVECIVPGHDDLGMEGFLEVRAGAPLVKRGGAAGPDAVSIENFSFDPPRIEVSTGTEVTWTNRDRTPHTVTADDGAFDSGTLDPGDTFSVEVSANGPVTYACVIHPKMTGTIVVG
jgi:plastocyanin